MKHVPVCPPLLSLADRTPALHTRMPQVYFNHGSIREGILNPKDILHVSQRHTCKTDTSWEGNQNLKVFVESQGLTEPKKDHFSTASK